ncbi:MAG: TonB family protein [Paracoccaceae bacterium]|nr:TonB family protein [Paracoccaceae bacterium]
MKPGTDLLAAFVLAAGVHGGLGLLIVDRAGGPGAGEERAVVPVVALDGNASLVSAWRAPPEVTEAVAQPAAPAPATTESPATPDRDRPPAAVHAAMAPTAPLPESRASRPSPTEAPRRPVPMIVDAPVAAFGSIPVAVRADPPEVARRADPSRRPPPPEPPLDAAFSGPPQADTLPPVKVTALTSADEATRPRPRPAPPASRADPARSASAAATPGNGARQMDAGRVQRLQSAWAGAIGAQIARAQRHPGRQYGAGRVRLILVVARDGQLAGVRVAASSGSPSLDRAALDAVRRAAPFPKAPPDLTEPSMQFGQWVAFRGP